MALQGRTLGLVGLGAVGGRVAHRGAAFGMQIVGSDPASAIDASLGFVERCSLDDVFRRADVVSIHAPLTNATVGLIGAQQFALAKPGTYLVNSARAAVVDEAALLDALDAGRLGGVGLDVYHEEPLAAASALLNYESVVLTPHIAGASDDVVTNHSRATLEAIVRLAAA